jgi:hypothetical protein
MKHAVVLALLALLVSVTAVADASASPGPFSTTGYTTAFEFSALPSGYLQFHIQARGGPAYGDDALCQSMYGAPCNRLCAAYGETCGVHGAFEGSFSFDEVGMGEAASLEGVNAGLLTLLTDRGAARLHFGGLAASSGVSGNFAFLGGTGIFSGWLASAPMPATSAPSSAWTISPAASRARPLVPAPSAWRAAQRSGCCVPRPSGRWLTRAARPHAWRACCCTGRRKTAR